MGEGLFYHVQDDLTFSQVWRKAGVGVNSIIFLERDFRSPLPWDIIDSGIEKEFLKEQFEKAARISNAYAK